MKNSVKISLIVLIAGLIVGGLLFLYRSGKNIDPITFVYDLFASDTKKTAEIEWPRYNQRTIGISFRHPPHWGSLRFAIEPCVIEGVSTGEYEEEPCMHVFLTVPDLEDNPLFMASQSTHFAEFGKERELYFGDVFSKERREGKSALEFMEDYCPEVAPSYNAQNCVRALNPNEVRYVKVLQDPFFETEKTKDKKIFYYLIYKEDSEFEGVIMSSELLTNLYSQRELERVMDKIMASVFFLE